MNGRKLIQTESIKQTMKLLVYPLLRAVAALIIGFLLIQYPDHTLTGLTVAIGILFLVA